MKQWSQENNDDELTLDNLG